MSTSLSSTQKSASQLLFERAKRRIPGGVNSPVRSMRSVGSSPFYTQSAQGALLTDVDGKEYIDFVGTWGPAILGHGHPVLQEALSKALEQGTSFGTCHPREVEMAERICQQVPGCEMVRMVNSGTEATMSALRLARAVTGRDRIVKFAGCYHGHVDALLVAAGSGALTCGQPDSAGVPKDFAALTEVLPFNDEAALKALFAEKVTELACVIIEPYPANTGLLLPEPGYLKALAQLCCEQGALLIFDEVMTGFRLAAGGAAELEGITADLVCMGKVIGGGLPVGAFGGKREYMELLAPLGPVYQAGTLSGNPLALAAGLAQITHLQQGYGSAEDGYALLERLGAQLEAGLRASMKNSPLPLYLQRAGSMWTLFFSQGAVKNTEDVQASRLDLFARFHALCLERGVFLPPSPYEAAFLSCAHSEAQVQHCVEVFADSLDQLAKEQ